MAERAGTAGGPDGPDGPVSTIHLARHGRTVLNTLGRVQGWSDSPLTAAGAETATRLGAGLGRSLRASGSAVSAVYAADMLRHGQTAELAARGLGVDGPILRDGRLRELDFGRFEGALTGEMWAEVAPALGYADEREAFADPGFDYRAALEAIARIGSDAELVAEAPADVAARALAALTAIAEAHPGADVLVVSSGITILTVLATLGADLSRAAGGIGNGAVNRLEYRSGSWLVRSVNDLAFVA